MKFYHPIEDLLERRRRDRRNRVTFGLFGILGMGLVLYWGLSAYRDTTAEARTDRIISLSSPDFTDVLSEGQAGSPSAALSADANLRDLRANRNSIPEFVDGVIEPNQTLFVAMREAGAEPRSIQGVVDSFVGTFDFRRSRPGDEWEVRLDEDGRIIRFGYTVSREEIYESVRRTDGAYESTRVDLPIEIVITGFGGTVLTSVYDAVAELGEGTQLATRFTEIFRWDCDFSRDARPGDTFRLITEKVMLEGELLRYGRVLAAEYVGSTGRLRAFAFSDDAGQTEYYTAEGEALRRRFLRAPLRYRRISSPFNRRRYHPVLNTYRAHLGVDYAAPTGTPIWAFADGRVTFADYRGGNGNLVVIQHDDEHETLYAHLSRFGPGIRRGREVSQGEVIGYVGNTGLSTGPHLHFGVRIDGEYIDPLSVQAERGPSLRGEDLARFRESVARYTTELEAIAIAPVDLTALPVEEEFEEIDLAGDFFVVDESAIVEEE